MSGGAKAVRSDGKTVTADTMVLHEDTKNIEAIGNSSITFLMEEKSQDKKPASNDMKDAPKKEAGK
jgi:hypothetical protein